ncbi:MAG: hypothetical protein HY675_12255 [Chloroflexi bacterium]|nr:hypothetical protein [Chloroflexota bacterium]
MPVPVCTTCRAPLWHINSFSRLIQKEYGDRLDERGKGYLRLLRDGSHRMDQLIDAMLKLSRVSPAETLRQPVDLSKIAVSTLAELRKEQPERQVDLTVAPNV